MPLELLVTMPSDHSHSSRTQNLLALILGIAAFLIVTDIRILNPTWVDWLLSGDPAQHWMGWQFYKDASFFQLPFGKNTNWGMDIGSSIVFSDSIPLLAMTSKLFRAILPKAFQYFGLWILLCFVLQSYFAFKLTSLMTSSRALQTVASAFLVFSPPMLWRLGGHYALVAHWMLLASLYLYFEDSLKRTWWIALCVIAALVHPYFLCMVFSVFLADMLNRTAKNTKYLPNSLILLCSNLIITFAAMWFAGYFVLGESTGRWGFGFCHMNLNSLFNPYNAWSLLLPSRGEISCEYEGFNYFGLGMMILNLVALIAIFIPGKATFRYKNILPLSVLFILFTLYAISNRVSFGEHLLFEYDIPQFAERLTATFRVSGRFFWICYYMLYLSILFILIKKLSKSWCMALFSFALALQLIDISTAIQQFRDKFSDSKQWHNPLMDTVWPSFAQRYKNLLVVFPEDCPDDWLPTSYFAAMNGMRINTGYFARINPLTLMQSNSILVADILSNDFNNDSLYVFRDAAAWELARLAPDPHDFVDTVDGLKILAPHYNTSGGTIHAVPAFNSDLLRLTLKQLLSDHAPLDYELGTTASFQDNAAGTNFLIQGWKHPDDSGTWSLGFRSVVAVTVAAPLEHDVTLTFTARAFVVNKLHTKQRIDVFINGAMIGTMEFQDWLDKSFSFAVRKERINNRSGLAAITFKYKDSVTPKSLGFVDGDELLALKLLDMKMVYQ